ncbi:MAG TPA: SLBB domain-containing protein [Thermodesulfovibrionales bacterium]|nr:SLBB domain-containing protein [Thermodesulfovibrionales bacterium]
MFSRKIAVILLVLLFPAFAFSQDYAVGERDVLRITVYDNPDLSTVARVSGEGTIPFPLLGEVQVAGMTIPQISKKISGLLAEGYLVNPQVIIYIEEFRSKKTTIIGEISKPGLYELPGKTTLLELLSNAGGLTKDAGDKAIVKRKAPQGEQTINVDLRRLIEKGDTSIDVALQDGDSIYVPKAGFFYVTGEVKKPDAYRFEEGTTVIKAITMAGGFTDKAAESRVKIKRRENGKENTIEKVKHDELVRSDDIIMVPESLF